MDLDRKLIELESSINECDIDLRDAKDSYIIIRLSFYELNGYSDIISELNRERFSCKSLDEKRFYVEKYKKVYLSERKMYRRILRNLENGTGKVLFPYSLKGNEELLYNILENSWEVDRLKSLEENATKFMQSKLKQKIRETNQELFKLKEYPEEYINTFSTFIGPYSIVKYNRGIVFYKDVFVAATESHSYSVFYNEETKESTKNALLNILAYYNGQPYFYFTENYDFNRKINELYAQFDLLDMLRLRKKNFFDSKQNEPFHLELPILKQKKNYNMVCIENTEHEMIFELYHASLKQFESLPRCVFLYRVFEYGSKKHYQPLMRPSDYKPEEALNYYVEKVMEHRFNPLYYVDFGTFVIEEEKKIVRKRKAKYINFTSKLKEEVKKIKKEWSVHPYLKNKSVGSIIYGTGRNAAAHGGGGRLTARYDYSMNYKHINQVNIFLELIARYIIETLNPQLSNMVERRTEYYQRYNQYKVFEEQD